MKRTRTKDPTPTRGGGLVYRGGLVSEGEVGLMGGRRTTSRRSGERVNGGLRCLHLGGRRREQVSTPQQGAREGAAREKGQQSRGRLEGHCHDCSTHEGENAEEESGKRRGDHRGN
jgi:hypothetical protein